MAPSRLRKRRDRAALSEFVDEADYMIDMEIDHSKKNRFTIDMDNSRWDKNYIRFLGDLRDYFEAKFVEEEEEEDPNYALFLGHLRENGSGYMLDVGLDSPIFYDVEADPSRGIKRRTRQGNNQSDGDVELDPSISNHITLFQKKRRMSVDRVSKSGFKNSSFVDKAHSDVTKRQTLGSKSSTYMLKKGRPPRSNHSTHIQMDVDAHSSPDLSNSDRVDKLASEPLHFSRIGTRRSTRDACKVKTGNLDVDRQSKSDFSISGHASQTNPSDASKEKSKKPRQRSYIQMEGGVNRKVKLGQAPDETYNTFLSCIKLNGESLIYEYGDHEQIRYEDTDEHILTESDAKTQPLKTAVKSPTRTGFQPRKATVKCLALTPAQSSEAALKSPTGTSMQPPKAAVKLSAVTPAQPPPVEVIPPTRPPIQPSKAAVIQVPEATVIQLPEAALESSTRSHSPPPPVPIAIVMPPTPSFERPNDTPTQPTPSSTALITFPISPTSSSKTPNTYLRSPSEPSIALTTTQRLSIPQSRPVINPSYRQNPTARHNTYLNTPAFSNYQAAYPRLFRKLVKMLKKPYDQKEYDDLFNTFSARKPVQTYRDSRSGGTQRPKGVGRSYFDLYKDLSLEVEKVNSDSHKVLNLLRMFRFYLEKLAHGNIPKPWLIDEFKSILPGSA